jgi:hypothetical protein
MGFFLSPFRFLFELIAFAIQAAFVYGLLLIVSVTIIWYGISTMPQVEPEVIVKTVIEKHEVTRFLEKEPTLTCERITGCELFPNAKTEKEYCPTCIMK